MPNEAIYQYQIGGNLPSTAPSYVVRQADEELFKGLKEGKFCYVFNSRQMGKSSLRVRVMQNLREAGVACAEIDLSGIGAKTEEQFYFGIINELVKDLQLPEAFDWQTRWHNQAPTAYVQRWGNFLDDLLLTSVQENIVIFIDEIDYVLDLQFPFEDFFAQIRSFYNKRAEKKHFQRLTFCLLGVATPSDLIQNKKRTPFNIGHAIELTGFEFEEVGSLTKGLLSKTNQPQAAMKSVLFWTGGQPFLTQKVCKLILESDASILEEQEAAKIEHLIRTKVIENWEAQDEPQHFRTIRDRLLQNGRKASYLLNLYQQILEYGQIPADSSSEQTELRLSGLVVKQQGSLKVYNPIYQAVFDKQWVEDELAKLQKRRVIRQRYEVLEELGDAYSIQTYSVRDLQLPGKIQFILKEITPAKGDLPFEKIRDLFTDAYLELQKLNFHPEHQIPNLNACFDENEKFYIVQDFVEGHNLDHDINPNSRWNEAEVINLLIDILEILEFIHAQNLSHLNLKPSNIRKRKQDKKIVLIDFGILKQISELMTNPKQKIQPQFLGTPGYFPHEGIETWSEPGLDIYATGIIGIQALTGIKPTDLPVDKQTGEVIWRFATSDKSLIQVSDELAMIIDKMICYHSEKPYHKVSQVLEELRNHRKNFKSRSRLWFSGKRVLVGCTIGLVLTSVLGYWWHRNSSEDQQAASDYKENSQLIEQCQETIQSQQNGSNTIDLAVIATAERVSKSCGQIIRESQSQSDRLSFLKNEGKALLVLGKGSLSLNHSQDNKNYLNNAKKSFQEALKISQTDPQSHFYLGFTKQLLGETGFESDYKKSIEFYLNPQSTQIQLEDYPIIARLAAFSSSNAFKEADRLYEKAINLKPEQPYLTNLYYNRGLLNYKNKKFSSAISIFGDALKISPDDQYIKKYAEECIWNGASNPSLCDYPNTELPSARPIYSCSDYPILAIARLPKEPSNLCE